MNKLLLMLVFSLVCSFQVTAKEQIIWLVGDSTSMKGLGDEGVFDLAVDVDNLLLKALPQYEVKLQQVPLERLSLLLAGSDSYCMSNRVKNKQRLEQNLFSLPTKAYPGLRLYWLADNQKLAKAGLNQVTTAMNFREIVSMVPKAVIGISGGRSYGEVLDKQIAELGKKHVFARHGQYRFTSLLKMFRRNNFDFVIESPNDMTRIFNDIKQTTALKSLPIKGAKAFHFGHIACSKTDKNRRYIADVDRALQKLYQSDEFYQVHVRYLGDELGSRSKLKQAFGVE